VLSFLVVVRGVYGIYFLSNMRVWSSYNKNGLGWFRIFGYGLKWKNIKHRPLLFSERHGYTKGITIMNWRISTLKRNRI